MVKRIRERAEALKREQNESLGKVRAGDTTALVVIDDKIKQRDAELGPPTYKTDPRIRHVDRTAALAGYAAGDKVGFARPVTAGEQPVKIERHDG